MIILTGMSYHLVQGALVIYAIFLTVIYIVGFAV